MSCTDCAELRKNEKKQRLDAARPDMEAKGKAQAIAAGREGFFIARSKNCICWQITLDLDPESQLDWEYVSIL